MTPGVADQLVLQGLALAAGGGAWLWSRRVASRVVRPAPPRRVLAVVGASSVIALALAVSFELSGSWASYLTGVVLVVAVGVLIRASVRWNAFAAAPVQAATMWSVFGLWMLGYDAVEALGHGVAFWHAWNPAIFKIELLAAVFFGMVQIASVKGERTHRARPRRVRPAQPTGASLSVG